MSTQQQFDAPAALKQIVLTLNELKVSVDSIKDKLTINELQSKQTDNTIAGLVSTMTKLSDTIVSNNNMSENLLKTAPTKKVTGDKKHTVNITAFWSANMKTGGERSFKEKYANPGESLGYYNRVPARVLQEALEKKRVNKTFDNNDQNKKDQLVYSQAWGIMRSYAEKHTSATDPDYELCAQCRELQECVKRDLKAFQDENGIVTGKQSKKSDKSTPTSGESSSSDAVVPSTNGPDVDITAFLSNQG